MAILKYYEQMRTNDVFSAELNGEKARFKFIGINLVQIQRGNPAFIMLKELITGEQLTVEADWFTARKLSIEHR